MKIFAYTFCALCYIVFFVIIALELCGHHIWKSNLILIPIATGGWTIAAIYEFKKAKNGR